MSGPIDLAKLPAPKIIDELTFEQIFNEMRDHLIELDSSLADVLYLESEPLVKLLQVSAMRELLLRRKIKNAGEAVMIAYATGPDLENLGALLKVQRLIVQPADENAIPPTPAVYEDDERYRSRIQLALDGLSTAGPERAYIYHALGASADVLDVSVDAPRFELHTPSPAVAAELPADAIVLVPTYSAGLSQPMPGDVAISVLSRTGDGEADPSLIDAVHARVSDDGIRPLTDNVHVRAADIIDYTISATLYTLPGPDSAVVIAHAIEQAEQYTQEAHRLGRSVNLSGIYASLHVPGVNKVEITQPTANITCNKSQAAHCTAIHVTYGGISE